MTTTITQPNRREVVAQALAEVGYHEGRNADGSWNNREKYAAEVGLSWVSTEGLAWCAVFAATMLKRGGLVPGEHFPLTASCDAAAGWYKQHGRWTEYPVIGGQVLYGTPHDLSHTGIVVDFDSTYVYAVEGNTNTTGAREGDGVYKKVRRRRDDYVVGYGRPMYADALDLAGK